MRLCLPNTGGLFCLLMDSDTQEHDGIARARSLFVVCPGQLVPRYLT